MLESLTILIICLICSIEYVELKVRGHFLFTYQMNEI